MKRATLVLILISALSVSSVVGVQTVKAQYTPDGKGCPLVGNIRIISPSNSTYNSNLELTLNITVQGLLSPAVYRYVMVYCGDGKDNVTIPIEVTFDPIEATSTYPNGTTTRVTSIFSPYIITGCVALPGLAEGSHSLTVYADYERINDTNTNWPALILDNSTVYFTISQQIEASPSTSPQQLGDTGVPVEYGIGILVASILILITISIVVSVYLKRRQ